ncbi:MAG: hypothetical protein V1755_05770 [Chloroflexota bacterium]
METQEQIIRRRDREQAQERLCRFVEEGAQARREFEELTRPMEAIADQPPPKPGRGDMWRGAIEQRDRLRIQLAGCLAAAEGWSESDPAIKGQYGWSVAYQKVLDLRMAYDATVARLAEVERERDRLAAFLGRVRMEEIPFLDLETIAQRPELFEDTNQDTNPPQSATTGEDD